VIFFFPTETFCQAWFWL